MNFSLKGSLENPKLYFKNQHDMSREMSLPVKGKVILIKRKQRHIKKYIAQINH